MAQVSVIDGLVFAQEGKIRDNIQGVAKVNGYPLQDFTGFQAPLLKKFSAAAIVACSVGITSGQIVLTIHKGSELTVLWDGFVDANLPEFYSGYHKELFLAVILARAGYIASGDEFLLTRGVYSSRSLK